MRQFVGVLLRRKNDGAVLVQHRDNNPDILSPNNWCIPGGAREITRFRYLSRTQRIS